MRPWIVAVVLVLAAVHHPVDAAPTDSAHHCTAESRTDQRIAVVCDMIAAWEAGDWNLATSLFAEDAVLHSMMIEPLVGRDRIGQRIAGLGASVTAFKFRILALGAVGDSIFFERYDEFTSNGHKGEVPIVGVLKVKNGKVTLWREYFDRAQLLRELGIEENLERGVWTAKPRRRN